MKLKVDVIREKGLDLEEPLQEKFVLETLGLVQGMKLLKPGTLKAHFDRVGTEVLIKASLECDLETPCKRCVACNGSSRSRSSRNSAT